MSLPLTKRGSTKVTLLPNVDAMEALFEIADTPEAAAYAVNAIETMVKDNNLGKVAEPLIKAAENNLAIREAQELNSNAIFSGILPVKIKTDVEVIARRAAEAFTKEVTQPITIYNEVGDDSGLIVDYFADGEPIAKESAAAMDELCSSWLKHNNLKTVGKEIYQTDKDGVAREKIDPKELRALIDDSKKGLKQFIEQKGIPIKLEQYEFPRETAEVGQKAP